MIGSISLRNIWQRLSEGRKAPQTEALLFEWRLQ